MKGFLQGLWVGAGAGTKKVENVVVSHSSFFRELLTEGEIYLEPISVKLRYATNSFDRTDRSQGSRAYTLYSQH